MSDLPRITKMFDLYAKSEDMELEELEQGVINAFNEQRLYLAVIETYYTTYCVGDTAERAKRGALTAALAFLKSRHAEMEPGRPYKNVKQVDETLGCNVWELQINKGMKEY